MVFFVNYLYSVIYAYCLGRAYTHYKLTDPALFILLVPILIVWLIICGGQYQVGTDYDSYLDIFGGNNLDYYVNKREFLFVGIVMFFNFLGIYGQGLFYIFYAVNIFFLFFILKRIPIDRFFIFILLYITVTSLFNNQLNILRQTTAIYIGTYAAFLVFENRKVKALFFILVATLIHQSGLILLSLFLVKKICEKLTLKLMIIFLSVAICLSFFFQIDSVSFVFPFLPEEYIWHILGGRVGERGILTKLTKYMFIPLYLLALNLYKKNKLNSSEIVLFKAGWISFCFRICVVNLTIVSRIADYFILLSIFPLLLYLNYLLKSNKVFLFISIFFLLSLFYGIKTLLFPNAEYLYNSIYV